MKMKLVQFVQSKKFQVLTWIVAGLVILLFVFHIGVMVGYRKASFSYRWGESYHRNFGGPREGFGHNFFEKDFIDSHGTFGQVIKIDGTSLVVKGRRDAEKVIVVKNDTVIRKGQDNALLADIKINDYIVTVGQPDADGKIEAKLIRIMPGSFTPKQ